MTALGAAAAYPRRKGWRYFLWVAFGAAACAVLLSVLRTGYYQWAGLRPQMGAGMFILFSPLFAAAFALLAVVCEGLVAWAALSPGARRPVLIGVSYAFVLVGLIRPELLALWLVFNPLALHLLFARQARRRIAPH